MAAFSEGMVSDGYEDVVNIDISSVVIEAMKKKHSNHPQLKCTYFFNTSNKTHDLFIYFYLKNALFMK